MKVFIDSAELMEITPFYLYHQKMAAGVTTNPSLIKKAVDARKGDMRLGEYIEQILRVAEGTPVSLEVTETAMPKMVIQGKALYERFNPIAGNVNIKIPVNPALTPEDDSHLDGIRAIEDLVGLGIPVNCTLVFSPEQAMLAAQAGASFISPFAGRVDDDLRKRLGAPFDKTEYYSSAGRRSDGHVVSDNGIVSGVHLVYACVQVMERFGYDAQILAASLRNPRQVAEVEVAGAPLATIPYGALLQMIDDPVQVSSLSLPTLDERRWAIMHHAHAGEADEAEVQNMLQHPKTYEGMGNFTRDIVPEYVALTGGPE
jgi:transaldolase